MGRLLITALAISQALALLVLVVRLLPGRTRRPPVRPQPEGLAGTSVTVTVATLNEAERVAPCLAGLSAQGDPLTEILVVDSRSTDGTRDLVAAAAARDGRITLVTDPEVPPGWVGKVWALQHGLSLAQGEWVLGVDADTTPQPGMVAGAVAAAQEGGFDVVSFSPRFTGMTSWEQWLQPSMLVSLIYRTGAAGERDPSPDRVLANGQCFLAKRAVLRDHGGYELARASWADDVSLARALAQRGVRVGFLDGSRLYDVRAYDGLRSMWREWGRSFDLTDATSRPRQWADLALIVLTQGLPWFVILAFFIGVVRPERVETLAWLRLNQTAVVLRVAMLLPLWNAYERRSLGYWLSPTSDPVAALRLVLSSLRRPRSWRGRRPQLDDA